MAGKDGCINWCQIIGALRKKPSKGEGSPQKGGGTSVLRHLSGPSIRGEGKDGQAGQEKLEPGGDVERKGKRENSKERYLAGNSCSGAMDDPVPPSVPSIARRNCRKNRNRKIIRPKVKGSSNRYAGGEKKKFYLVNSRLKKNIKKENKKKKKKGNTLEVIPCFFTRQNQI